MAAGDSAGGGAAESVRLVNVVIAGTSAKSTKTAPTHDASTSRRRRTALRWRPKSRTRAHSSCTGSASRRGSSGRSGSASERGASAWDADGGGTMAKPSVFTLTSTNGWRRRSSDGEPGARPDSPRRRSTTISSPSCESTMVRSATRSSPDRTGSLETMHKDRSAGGSDIGPPFGQGCLTETPVAIGPNTETHRDAEWERAPVRACSSYIGPRWWCWSPIFSAWRRRRRSSSADPCRSRGTPSGRRPTIPWTPCSARQPTWRP